MILQLMWDSELMGFPVGKLEILDRNITPLELVNKFTLVYVFSDSKLSDDNLKSFSGEIYLVDEKIIYKKIINPIKNHPLNIKSLPPEQTINNKLMSLAYQSGAHSRFKNDKRLPQTTFESLYRIWLEKSVKREIAKEVFVYQEIENEINGFVTLGESESNTEIGLIAVDSSVQSKGIGSMLLSVCEKWSAEGLNKNEIKVATQKSNIGACKFYERNGYSVDQITYVYHWWNNI